MGVLGKTGVKQWLLASTTAVVCMIGATPVLAQTRTFDVPAQPAIQGIPLFGKQAGIQILASATTLADKRTNEVKGDYTVEAGLAQLLGGTGLEAVSDSVSGITTIRSVAPESATTEIVVKGIKRSLQKSATAKKNSDEIVEVVSAEDVGKLPGTSIAESLARLPGVAAQRVDGRAEYLSIRGMDPQFGVTLLNGMEMVSTGDDRSFEYDQFPAELVSSATLYKTPDASLGTMGLSGTIDIRTLNPLDFHGRKVTLNGSLETNSFGKLVPGTQGNGGRYSLSYIDQFDGGKLGVAIGYAHLDSPTQRKYFNPWDYGIGNDLGVEGAGDAYTFDGFETGVQTTQSVRDGLLGVVQYKPNDVYSTKVDIFHSQFDERMSGVELDGVTANWATGTIASTTVDGNTNIVTNASPIVTTRQDVRRDTINAINWTNTLSLGQWTLRGDIGLSHARRNEWVGEAYMMSETPIGFSFSVPTSLTGFSTVSTDTDFADTSRVMLATAWGAEAGAAYASQAYVTDRMTTARLSAKRFINLGIFNAFEAGVLYSERSKDLEYSGVIYNLSDGSDCLNGLLCQSIPSSIPFYTVDMGFTGLSNLIGFVVRDALNSGAYIADPDTGKDPAWNWGVSEKVTTAFAKLNISSERLLPIRGNLGVQFVNTDQSATGLYIDSNGDASPVSGGADYSDVLPSLNLTGELGNSMYLRFGAAKALSRANMADMRAGITAAVSSVDRKWYGDGGNPELKPWQSYDYDLSLEKYFGKTSYVALAAFYKDITRGIVSKSIAHDFSSYTNTSGVTPVSDTGTLTTLVNTTGGKVEGWELSWTLDGALLNPKLDGFGVTGSFANTHVKANTDADGAVVGTLMEGLSKNVWNGSVYYEKNGYQVRIAERYRSGYSASRHDAFRYITETIRPETILDAQLGYTFQSGQLKNLTLLLQGSNLTNEPYVTTQTVNGQTALNQYHEFGRQVLLGFSYSF